MKKIISVILSVTIAITVFSSIYGLNLSAEQYDPFGTVAMGPGAPEVSATYSNMNVVSFNATSYSLVINGTINNKIYSLYLALPELGGIRIYGANQGDFAPDDFVAINYTSLTDTAAKMVTSDGTGIDFSISGTTFNIKVTDQKQKELFTINSNQLKLGFSSSGELVKVKLEMPLETDEIVYGTGERFSGVNQNGKRTILWNADCGYHGDVNNTAELWRGYKNVPILHSDRGYTLYYDSYYSANVDIGYTNSDVYSLDFCGNVLDFYIWTGTPLENIQKYTDLTGKSILPDKWAFSFLAGAGTNYWFKNGSTINNVNGVVSDVVQNFTDLGTPNIAAIYLEGITDYRNFNAEQQAVFYQTLSANGIRGLQWNRPDLEKDVQQSLLSSNTVPIVKDVNGNDSGTFIDFTDSKSKTLLSNWLNPYMDLGLRGGLLDFGELIQTVTVFSSGETGMKMHNKFSYIYAKGYYDAFSKKLGSNFITFARAASAGTQSYTGLFSGDQSADFKGLRQQLSAGLSVSSSGFSVWGPDMAGYEGTPTSEVYCRGMAFSAFCPVMRAHGTTSRFPWDYGTVAEQAYKKFYWTRENLLNTIYSSAVKSSKDGTPIMRAMAMQYPEQKNLASIEDEYIFCEDLLVAPVLTEGATSRNVTLPSGKWYDLFSGSMLAGGNSYNVSASLDEIPVYVKEGAMLPIELSSSLNLTDSMLNSRVDALLVTPSNESITKTHYFNSNSSVTYEMTKTQNGYVIKNDGNNKAKAISAYGIDAAQVKVDGISLTNVGSTLTSAGTGFRTNSGNTVISLNNSNWKEIEILVDGIAENSTKTWSFGSNNSTALNDFDAYMNDSAYGYEKQTSTFRWITDNGYIRNNAWMCKEADKDYMYNSKGRWGGVICSSYSSISPKDVELTNFETTMVFQNVCNTNTMGSLSIGFRENEAGRHTNLSNGDNWSLGTTGTGKSGLVSVVNGNVIWLHTAGSQTLDSSVSSDSVNFRTGFYALKLRVVGNSLTISVGNEDFTTTYYENTVTLPESINHSGRLSYYGNVDSRIKSVSVTALDSNGNAIDYFPSENATVWDFSSENQLSDFDAYINSTTFGYENQSIGNRINYDYVNGSVKSNNLLFSNKNESNTAWGGVVCSSNIAISPKNVKLKNFETTVKFKVASPEGAWGAVSVGFRETYKGLHANLKSSDSWNFGIQYNGKRSALVTALQSSSLWVDASGTKILEAGVSNGTFTSNYHVMKLRVVGDVCTIGVYSADMTLLYYTSIKIPASVAQYGGISYYMNNGSQISQITLTELDDNGNAVNLKKYNVYDCNFDNELNQDDISGLVSGLLTDEYSYGFDINNDCLFNICDLLRLKKGIKGIIS